MYWLERFICHDAMDKAYFEVRDVLSVPQLTSNQVMADSCSVDEDEIPLIIAFGKYKKNQAPVPIQDMISMGGNSLKSSCNAQF